MPEARSRSRSRSRSPSSRELHHRSHRHRSTSPSRKSSQRHHHPAHHRSHAKDSARRLSSLDNPYARPLVLPYQAPNLSKRDLPAYTAMFASYLDIQKQIALEDLEEKEVKGRWKRFCGKWNRCELAEGWYDPITKEKADAYAAENPAPSPSHSQHNNDPRASPSYDHPLDVDSDDYGPRLAPPPRHKPPPGAANPTFAELADRDEQLASSLAASRADLRHDRQLDRKQQRAALDELAPRAEPGTRERQLEKKREAGAAAREFREGAGGGGGVEEVAEGELLGGQDGGVEGVRRLRKEDERKKNEREVRREEALRARAAEREGRLAGLRDKEEKTMGMLRAIAKERFG